MSLADRLLGRALASHEEEGQKVGPLAGVPMLGLDALSSAAYGPEATLTLLLPLGALGLAYVGPITLLILALLTILYFSYRQTIVAYPTGGGSYTVAKENLGTRAGLLAAASLLLDYVLNVAVGIAAGVGALVSALPALHGHILALCLIILGIVALLNLRGVREAGWFFAGPSYLFIFSIIATIIAGLVGMAVHAPHVAQAVQTGDSFQAAKTGVATIGLYALLRAFSQGCAALTGVEAISNTVPLFQEPRTNNAATTTNWMGVLAITMFVGLTVLTLRFGIHAHLDANQGDYQSVVGQVANTAWPPVLHWMFYVVQYATAAILIIAANAAFAGFPQLASMLARDNFLPRQLANIGDRLAFSNGILVLAIAACFLLYIFKGIVDDLLSLYAIGVFTSFTLAQIGMVLRWNRTRVPGWQSNLFFNALGALATGVVTLIIGVSKFADGKVIFSIGKFAPHYGAWIVIVLVPLMVWTFLKINRHYTAMTHELSLAETPHAMPSRNVVLVLVPRLHRGIVNALNYAHLISDDARAIYIETNPQLTAGLKKDWNEWGETTPLVVMESPYRSLIGPLMRYVDAVQKERSDDVVTIILPQLVSRKWWHAFLHNQYAPLLRLALSHRKDVVLTNVRYFLEN